MNTEVFVSYSNQDYERVMPLVERLRGGGVAIWVDEGGIDAATLWSESIVEAIAECKVLIMMVSSHSTDSHNVVKEVMIASESKKTILPIYLEPAEIPAKLKYQLTGIQHLEWFDSGSDEVFETLKDGLAKRGVTIDGKITPTQIQTYQAPGQTPSKTNRRNHRPPNGTTAQSSPTKNIALTTLTIACAILVSLLLGNLEPNTPSIEEKPIHLPINIPKGENFYFDINSQFHRSIAVSPNGQYFTYITGQKADSDHTLWLHSLESNKRINLRTSNLMEGIYDPFFSPDSRWLVFFDNGKMNRISTSTNEHNIICDASLVQGGTWGENNVIYFSPNEGSQLQAIDINKSNDPEIVDYDSSNKKALLTLGWPDYLPNEKGLLFFDFGGNINANYGTIYHMDLRTKKTTVLVKNGFAPKYSKTGHLLYTRDNALKARTFDISTLTVGHDEVTLVSGIRMNPFWGNAQYSISDEGTLAYISGTNLSNGVFSWVDRKGLVERIEQMKPNVYCRFALNSTGEKVAVPISRERADIYVFDLASGASTPITRKNINHHPVWSPDDSKIIYTKKTPDRNLVMQINSNGSGTSEMLYENSEGDVSTEGWSEDGAKVSIADFPERTGYLDLNENPPKFKELASSKGTTIFGLTFSPNGKWISFGSSITGGYSCYIAPIDKPDQAQLITKIYKGEEPRWSPKGDEIFYRGAKGLYSVPLEFDSNDNVVIGKPTLIVNIPWIDNWGIGYDVHPSGQKFLVVVHEKVEVVDHFNIVLNFDTLIEQKFAELKNSKQP